MATGRRSAPAKLSRCSRVETENILLVCAVLRPFDHVPAASAGIVLLLPRARCARPRRGQLSREPPSQGTHRPCGLRQSWAPISLPRETGGSFRSFSLVGRTVPSLPGQPGAYCVPRDTGHQTFPFRIMANPPRRLCASCPPRPCG